LFKKILRFEKTLDLIKRLIDNKVMENTKLNQENTKNKIFDAALKLFGQKGFDGTSTRDICKLAGVNISMISYHFGGKQELLDALVVKMINSQNEYMSSRVDFDTDLGALSREEKIAFLINFLDKFIDFMYGTISTEHIRFFLRVQYEPKQNVSSKIHDFLSKIMASIVKKDPEDKEVMYRLLFTMSQIAFPRMLPAFSPQPLKKCNFDFEDVGIIKMNMKRYLETSFKEDVCKK